MVYRSNQHFSIICKNNYSVANQPTKRSVLLAKPVIRFFNGGKMKKFKAKIYLKNKKELNEYLKNLVKIKKNPTLEDVKFSFKWGTIPCDQ